MNTTQTNTQPEAEDYTISNCGSLGSQYAVGIVEGKFLGQFKTYSETQLAIREDMERNQFWPNVWQISDHGNAELVQLTG